MNERSCVAVYWDFENIHAAVLDAEDGEGTYRKCHFRPQRAVVDLGSVFDCASRYGEVAIHRAYANWQWFGKYRRPLLKRSVELVQMYQLSGAKNGADIRLALDAMEDLANHRHVGTVVVVAGDSDYVALVQKVRRRGRRVVGIGLEESCNRYWIDACDEFNLYRSIIPSAPADDQGEEQGDGDESIALVGETAVADPPGAAA